MSGGALTFTQLAALTGDRLGIFDQPCPACGPLKDNPASRNRRVLRIWHERPGFLTFCCARCGIRGWAHDSNAKPLERGEAERRMRAADAQHTIRVQQRRKLARYLWDGAQPIRGTFAERYLRHRGITCPLPDTLRFLPARGQHPPALVAAFGVPSEPIPGHLDVEHMAVRAVHLTRLREDGRGKADVSPTKIMVGPSMGVPIVLASVNDVGGLAICEGLEDALSLHAATGLGAWAAGCANRLPALAQRVPHYVQSVTIAVDDDEAGQRYSRELGERLIAIRGRRFEVVLLEPGRRAAA